eukprot:SAG22_NODE_1136_length_5395_cov_2.101189_7_plen_429_part_01
MILNLEPLPHDDHVTKMDRLLNCCGVLIVGGTFLTGGDGQGGINAQAGGGGGGGGGALKLTCGGTLTITQTGRILAEGGDGGGAQQGSGTTAAGGSAIAGGGAGGDGGDRVDGGRNPGADGICGGPNSGEQGCAYAGRGSAVATNSRCPAGGSGGGYGTAGADGRCGSQFDDARQCSIPDGGTIPAGGEASEGSYSETLGGGEGTGNFFAADVFHVDGGNGGGGGAAASSSNREGAGGGGSGGAIWLIAPAIANEGIISALGGIGGRDDGCDGAGGQYGASTGGMGGDGRIRFDADSIVQSGAGMVTPAPGRRPALVPLEGGDVVIGSGRVVSVNTDSYSSVAYASLTIEDGGVLNAVGSRPLVVEVTGACVVDGRIDVAGSRGLGGWDGQSGGGGGGGGGAVSVSCGTSLALGRSGVNIADGGGGDSA